MDSSYDKPEGWLLQIGYKPFRWRTCPDQPQFYIIWALIASSGAPPGALYGQVVRRPLFDILSQSVWLETNHKVSPLRISCKVYLDMLRDSPRNAGSVTIIKRWMLDAIFLIDRMSCMWLQHSRRRIYFSPPFNSHSVWKHANATPAKWLNWDVEKMWKLNCETALTPTGIPGIPSIPSIPGIRVCL